MTEAPTPRTDARVRELESEEDHYYSEMIQHSRQLETDLQHLARVAGEALDKLEREAEAVDETGDEVGAKHLLQWIKEQRSEIQRIKNQTK